MPTLDPHHATLRQQWIVEAEALEQRRQRLLAAAGAAADALRQGWPQLEAVWLFGSTAMAVVERQVDAALAAAGEAGVAIDLVRLEDLEPHWQQRIRERACRLT